MRLVHEVTETTGSANEHVAALGELLYVELDREATVGRDRAELGPIRESACFVEDLFRQFAGWTDDDHQRLSTNTMDVRVVVCCPRVYPWSTNLVDSSHQLRDDGSHISGGLARAGLCNGDEVITRSDRWDRICLNSCRRLVATLNEVVEHHRVQAGVMELQLSIIARVNTDAHTLSNG